MQRILSALLLALLLVSSLQDRAWAASTPPEKTASGSPGENPNKHATFNPVLTIQLQRDAAMWGEGTVLDVDVGPNLYAYVRQNPWTKFDPYGLWLFGYDTFGDYASDVGSYAKGYFWDGPKAMVTGTYDAVVNYKETGAAIKTAVTNPKQTGQAIVDGTKQMVTDMASGDMETAGKATFDVVTTVLSSTKASKLGDLPGGKKKGSDPSNGNGPSGQCFAAGTLILCQSEFIRIEDVEVGQRVLTSPEDEQVSDTSVDPDAWRVFEFTMVNPRYADDTYQITLLRPVKWIERTPKNNEGQVRIELHEMGVSGWADLVAVKPCPPIQPGKGRVVLMTINHDNTFLYQLNLESRGPPMKVTGYHPLFSESRQQWVQVYDLSEGEELRTQHGVTQITEKRRIAGRYEVYNLEVEADHRYYAGDQRVLAHNTCFQDMVMRRALGLPVDGKLTRKQQRLLSQHKTEVLKNTRGGRAGHDEQKVIRSTVGSEQALKNALKKQDPDEIADAADNLDSIKEAQANIPKPKVDGEDGN